MTRRFQTLDLRKETFVQDYNALRLAAAAIAALEPCPFAGKVTTDQVLMAFGAYLNVWSQGVMEDVHVNRHSI